MTPPPRNWKVVNRYGQKPNASRYKLVEADANILANVLNARGKSYDDGPYTVAPWGEVKSWYGEEGRHEAAVERGEEPV